MGRDDSKLTAVGLYGTGECSEEYWEGSKAEFARDNDSDMNAPEFQRVMDLKPGEEMVLDIGAGGAWRIRCGGGTND